VTAGARRRRSLATPEAEPGVRADLPTAIVRDGHAAQVTRAQALVQRLATEVSTLREEGRVIAEALAAAQTRFERAVTALDVFTRSAGKTRA
jgi:hypothetical protein